MNGQRSNQGVPGGLGLLATIDGPVGVGKTTVTALTGARLAEHGLLRGDSAAIGLAMGKLARASTYDLRGLPLTFLMAADRYHHQDHVIAPALKAGQVVVCDRYVTTALVLDQIDGADPELHLEHLPVPALAGSGGHPRRRPGRLPVTRGCAAAFTAVSTRAVSSRRRPKPPSTPGSATCWLTTATPSKSSTSITTLLSTSPTASSSSSGTALLPPTP